MNTKRIIIAFCALLVFFGMATWTDLVPTAAPFAIFIATVAGFFAGYLFRKDYDQNALIDAHNENDSLTEEVMVLKAERKTLANQIAEFKKANEHKPRKKKPKEEPKGE